MNKPTITVELELDLVERVLRAMGRTHHADCLHNMARPLKRADRVRIAEQTYTAADLAQVLRIPSRRISLLVEAGDIPPAAFHVPGGGHKGRRWFASQVIELCARWAVGPVWGGTCRSDDARK